LHICTVPELLGPLAGVLRTTTRITACCPTCFVVVPEFESGIMKKIVGIIGTSVACCIIPLQCAMATLQIAWDEEPHGVDLVTCLHWNCRFIVPIFSSNLPTSVGWWQVPTLWMARVVALTISFIAVATRRAAWGALQNPGVQAFLTSRCGLEISVQRLVADAKFVVAPVMG